MMLTPYDRLSISPEPPLDTHYPHNHRPVMNRHTKARFLDLLPQTDPTMVEDRTLGEMGVVDMVQILSPPIICRNTNIETETICNRGTM